MLRGDAMTFGTIDHLTILRRLEHSFGLSGMAIRWIRSYIIGRTQFVRVSDCQSASVTCEFGVPQGSVLGPLLYALYVAPLASVIASFNVSHMQYADDTQLYIALEGSATTTIMESCLCAIKEWFTMNGLSLNPGKSEAIVTGTSARQRTGVAMDSVILDAISVPTSSSVKSLGVKIDNSLSFNEHVATVYQGAYYHIKALRHIRKCLTDDDAEHFATAMVTARLNYCNSVLYKTS
jgi:Reverse transcriptase (RNA-dependent DNA polymerase)